MKLFSTENFLNLKVFPAFWHRRRQSKSFKIRAKPEDTFHTSYHYSRSSSCQPVNMRASKVFACFSLCKLTIAVWLKTTDFGTVILRSRRIFHKIGKSTFSMTAECFSKNQPALGLGENTGVFFGTLIIDNCQCTIESMCMVRRIHKDCAIFRIQTFIYII